VNTRSLWDISEENSKTQLADISSLIHAQAVTALIRVVSFQADVEELSLWGNSIRLWQELTENTVLQQ